MLGVGLFYSKLVELRSAQLEASIYHRRLDWRSAFRRRVHGGYLYTWSGDDNRSGLDGSRDGCIRFCCPWHGRRYITWPPSKSQEMKDRMSRPNEVTSADGGWHVLFPLIAQWPATTEFFRWAAHRLGT